MKVRSENEPEGPPLLPDRVSSVTLRPRIPASWQFPLFSLVLRVFLLYFVFECIHISSSIQCIGAMVRP
jgi:hypothetical protein